MDLKRCNENTRPDASEDCNLMACDEGNTSADMLSSIQLNAISDTHTDSLLCFTFVLFPWNSYVDC